MIAAAHSIGLYPAALIVAAVSGVTWLNRRRHRREAARYEAQKRPQLRVVRGGQSSKGAA
ncbi:MAG: hypothetical protein JWO62_2684 [Acidimicrobiaceae bacterium]|nr:hypothetical protein [Acidimicrobiaceae bacterium]